MSRAGFDPALAVRSSRLAALFAARQAAPWQPAPDPAPPPVDAATLADDAWARGLAAGTAAARAELVPVFELLEAGVVALRRAREIDVAALRQPFAALVTQLCGAVVAQELRLAPEHVLALIEPALAAISSDTQTVLRLHPDDAALLDDAALAPLPVPVVADPLVARGSVRIEAPQFVV
ncbi:MAG: FliH/SctL family protein, partial [Polymorphobacter sp.]